ncbi:MAG: glycoside hydrolase family 66 protein [Acidimicrobiales bacterium]
MPFAELKTFYRVDEEIELVELPVGTSRVLVRDALGAWVEAGPGDRVASERLGTGTHSVEAWSGTDVLVGEELTTVGLDPGQRPVMGFATSLDEGGVEAALDWCRALRCTVVQVYDWMASYSRPIGAGAHWSDPLGRPVSRQALQALTGGLGTMGAVAQAYAPVYASDREFAAAHASWRLYRSDGAPQRLGELLEIMGPEDVGWQRHWLGAYGGACDALGFTGLHLDSYGYPRSALDAEGRPVLMEEAYAEFIRAVRAGRPGDVLSFNQVNGVPPAIELPEPPGFRYCEVWPPNDRWRHLEGLLDRSAAGDRSPGDTLALYPPVWGGDRQAALRTVLLTEAIATMLGANVLVWGDDHGVLDGAYYPDHERLQPGETGQVLAWHRFSLRCRDLFTLGTDTSWYEIGDENAAVSVSWGGITSPEPLGGAVFARVGRRDDAIIVGVLDLTGSEEGRWSDPTGEGRCSGVDVTVLLDAPEGWIAEAAVLGSGAGRFCAIAARGAVHREGRAVAFQLPMLAGWSVLRLRRR